MGAVNRPGRFATGLLATVVLALLAACESPQKPSLDPALWADYRQRLVRDGRVVDTGNDDISHSEGQGYGMLLAVAADDRKSFDALWQWTARVLQRKDALLRWSYRPCPAEDVSCVTDNNNASDGDLLVAWALLRAFEAWDNVAYRASAHRILAAVEQHLVIEHNSCALLLPGAKGFRHDGSVTVNLSYWVFPALQAFEREQPDGPWRALIDCGVRLVDAARFGEAQLPPDWLELDDDGLRPSPRFPPRYGFDAVRIPLYMAWAGLEPADGWRSLAQLWQSDPVPAWVDLEDGSTAEYAWSPGAASVAALLGSGPGPDPRSNSETDYYSYTLRMLSHLAAKERQP